MARAFTTNQQISGTTTVGRNQTNFSIAGWLRRPSSATQQFFGSSESSSSFLGIQHAIDNNVYFLLANGPVTYGFSSQNITGWNHWTFTFDGSQTGNANRLKVYVNGVAVTLGFIGTIPSTTSNNVAVETIRIGRLASTNSWSTGDFAELGMWQATLTAEEAASLARGMTCDKIRPQSLVYYTPLIRDIQDLARGMTLTDTNSTVANHPRVYA
jgi:hypothetical protein